MGAARAAWDEAAHFRGYHGRFAGGASREPTGRSAAAFKPRQPESAARSSVSAQVNMAHKVHGAYFMRELNGNRDGGRNSELTEYQSPRKRERAIRETGSAARPVNESLQVHVGLIRQSQRSQRGTLSKRVGVKTTFTGKKRVVRQGQTVSARDAMRRR